jgi:hypothetical protein
MDKNEINELYKRFNVARSVFQDACRDLATALNTPDNCRIISKKTRTAFRKGHNTIKSVDLYDERSVYDLFNMLMILDILDGTYEMPEEEIEIYEDEIVDVVEPEVEDYITPELDVDVVDEPFELTESVIELEVETTKSSYASQETDYKSASSSYDDSSSSYDSGDSTID